MSATNKIIYNRDAYGLPPIGALEGRVVNLRLSRHASERASERNIRVPLSVVFSAKTLVQLEFEDGKLARWVVRLDYDARRDICLCVDAKGVLVTVFLNYKDDLHESMDRSKYAIVA